MSLYIVLDGWESQTASLEGKKSLNSQPTLHLMQQTRKFKIQSKKGDYKIILLYFVEKSQLSIMKIVFSSL